MTNDIATRVDTETTSSHQRRLFLEYLTERAGKGLSVDWRSPIGARIAELAGRSAATKKAVEEALSALAVVNARARIRCVEQSQLAAASRGGRLSPTLRAWLALNRKSAFAYSQAVLLVALVALAVTGAVGSIGPEIVVTIANAAAACVAGLTFGLHGARTGETRFPRSDVERYLRHFRSTMVPDLVERTANSVSAIHQSLIFLFLMWALLYAVMWLTALGLFTGNSLEAVVDAILTLINNLSAVAMLSICYVMAFATDRQPTTLEGTVERPAIEIGATVVTAVTFAVQLALSLANEDLQNTTSFVFGALSGLISCVALGLWAARLDSKLIDGNFKIMAALFCYAAIQPFWIVVSRFPLFVIGPLASTLKTILFLLALGFKVLLFAFCYWLIHTGRLSFYLAQICLFRHEIPAEWGSWTNEKQKAIGELGTGTKVILRTIAIGCASIGLTVGVVFAIGPAVEGATETALSRYDPAVPKERYFEFEWPRLPTDNYVMYRVEARKSRRGAIEREHFSDFAPRNKGIHSAKAVWRLT